MPEEILLDVRDLEPPEPFERATETLRVMRHGQYLKLVIPRQPRMLYPWLHEQGYRELTIEVREDLFEIYIWHTGDGECAAAITARRKVSS